MGLFGKKKSPKAALFVDFDFWKASMDSFYREPPDVSSFMEIVKSKYDLKKSFYFGRFTSLAVEQEVRAIKESGSVVVDTQDPENQKFERIDFVILEYMYRQIIIDKEICTVILFSGDNQFFSFAKFIKEELGKRVVLAGVRATLPGKFRAACDDVIEVPGEEIVRNEIYKMIVDNFRYIYRHKDKQIYPTFLSTVTAVARLNEMPEDEVRRALQELIDKRIIFKSEVQMNQGENTVRVLRLDKSRAMRAGLYVTD